MISNTYTEENSKAILEKLYEKGWAVHGSTNSRLYIEHLEINGRYAIIPKAETKRSSDQALGNLEKWATRLNGKTPTIEIYGKRYKWTGFSLFNSQVIINTSEGIYISYPNFIKSLETIADINGA